MPSFNQGRYIGDALKSVVEQSLSGKFWQLIVQDNCSSDETKSVLEKYRNISHVDIHVEADSGQADALRRGFERAEGEIFCWLNSDDVLLPSTLETVRKYFTTHPEVDVVYGDAFFMDELGCVTGRYPTGSFNAKLLENTCYLSQPSVFFRRSIYEKVGGITTKYHFCMDYDLWLQFSLAGAKFGYLKELFSATRIHNETKTSTGGEHFVQEVCAMLKHNIGKVPASWELYVFYSKMKQKTKGKYRLFLLSFLASCFRHPSKIHHFFSVVKHFVFTRFKNYFRSRREVGLHYEKVTML